MKSFIFNLILSPVILLAACTNQQQQVSDFIPGTYVNHAQSAYSIADDTLIIAPDAQIENGYHVSRKTGFCRVLNGQLQPAQHKSKVFTAIWDAQKQTLQITENGIMLLFQPGGNQLMVQNSKYRKL
jgi:hypothetical protein